MAGNPLGVIAAQKCCPTVSNKTRFYKIYILIFTFFIYCSYHLSRKPISVVKSVLHQTDNCPPSPNHTFPNETTFGNVTDCTSWPPFDHDNYEELYGSLDSAYLFSYAFFMFVSGHVAERVSLRYFLAAGMLASGITTALFGLGKIWQIHSLPYYLVVQVFGGAVQSSGWPSVVATVANWHGKGNRGLVMGIWNSHTSFGNILGSVIGGDFVNTNWAWSFIVPGIIIGSLGILVFFFLTPYPEDVGCEKPNQGNEPLSPEEEPLMYEPESQVVVNNPNQPEHTEEKAISLLTALKIPGVAEFAFCLFFAKLVSYTFLFWLPKYIKHTSTLDPEKSADLSTLFDFGGIAGGITAGVLSDKSGARACTCAVMLTIAAPMLFIYRHFGATGSFELNVALLLLTGAFVNGPYALITTAVSADLGTHKSLKGNSKAKATVTAIIDGTGSIGAALGPLLTGLITPTGWDNVFYMLISSIILALLLLSRLVYKEITTFRCCRRNGPIITS